MYIQRCRQDFSEILWNGNVKHIRIGNHYNIKSTIFGQLSYTDKRAEFEEETVTSSTIMHQLDQTCHIQRVRHKGTNLDIVL